MKVAGIKFFVAFATICTFYPLFGQDQAAAPKDPVEVNATAPKDPTADEKKTDAPQARPWWDEGRPRRPRNNAQAKKLPLIRVQGNKFVDPQGKTVIFRGVSIADPDKI